MTVGPLRHLPALQKISQLERIQQVNYIDCAGLGTDGAIRNQDDIKQK